jgi:hypothetical protein
MVGLTLACLLLLLGMYVEWQSKRRSDLPSRRLFEDQTRVINQFAQVSIALAFLCSLIAGAILTEQVPYLIKVGLLVAPWTLSFICFQTLILLRVRTLDIASGLKKSTIISSSLFICSSSLLLCIALRGF